MPKSTAAKRIAEIIEAQAVNHKVKQAIQGFKKLALVRAKDTKDFLEQKISPIELAVRELGRQSAEKAAANIILTLPPKVREEIYKQLPCFGSPGT
jgi:hypothetical protein